MKLQPQQLSQHLKRELAPIYLISGDEILLIQESCTAIRETAKNKGFSERICLQVNDQFQWEQFLQATQNLSLFNEKRLIELQIPNGKPGTQGSKVLQAYVKQIPNDIILLIITNKLESSSYKTQWYQAIDRTGVVMPIWPIDRSQLPQWIKQRAENLGLQMDAPSLQLLADHTEGNLVATAQEIEKLYLLFGTTKLTIDDIKNIISDNSRYDVFKLVDSALQGDNARVVNILHHLETDGTAPAIVLWALAREIRTLAQMAYQLQQGANFNALCQQFQIWEQRKPLIKKVLQQHNYQAWRRLLQAAHEVDLIIKGINSGNAWQSLLEISWTITK